MICRLQVPPAAQYNTHQAANVTELSIVIESVDFIARGSEHRLGVSIVMDVEKHNK